MVEPEGKQALLGRFDGVDADAAPLVVHSRRVEDRSIVTPIGDVDLSTSEVLARELQRVVEPGVGLVEVDCAGITFLDSSGINVVLQAWQHHAERTGVRITVVNAPGVVARVLQVAGVWELLQP